MKRADLKVGSEYGANSRNDWEARGTTDWGKSRRVKVIDTGQWQNPSYYLRAEAKLVALDDGRQVTTAARKDTYSGRMVLVQCFTPEGKPEGNPMAMGVREIRAPWAEVAAKAAAVDAALGAKADAAKAARDHAMTLYRATAAMADTYGVKLPEPHQGRYNDKAWVYVLDVDMLAELMEVAK